MEHVHVVHPKDVVKSHEEHVRGACGDKAQLLLIWYLSEENQVCWIILFEKPPLHIYNTIMEATHIPGQEIDKPLRKHRFT